jgi:hypothetical protein
MTRTHPGTLPATDPPLPGPASSTDDSVTMPLHDGYEPDGNLDVVSGSPGPSKVHTSTFIKPEKSTLPRAEGDIPLDALRDSSSELSDSVGLCSAGLPSISSHAVHSQCRESQEPRYSSYGPLDTLAPVLHPSLHVTERGISGYDYVPKYQIQSGAFSSIEPSVAAHTVSSLSSPYQCSIIRSDSPPPVARGREASTRMAPSLSGSSPQSLLSTTSVFSAYTPIVRALPSGSTNATSNASASLRVKASSSRFQPSAPYARLEHQCQPPKSAIPPWLAAALPKRETFIPASDSPERVASYGELYNIRDDVETPEQVDVRLDE